MIFYYLSLKTVDFGIRPTKKQICAVKEVLFRITQQLVGVCDLPNGLPGGQVELQSVMVWNIREMRLHGVAECNKGGMLHFNQKLDGHGPFWGERKIK